MESVVNKMARYTPSLPILAFVCANIAGLAVFFLIVNGIDEETKLEQRDYYDFGDALTFNALAYPIFLVFFVAFLIASIKGLISIIRRRNYQLSLALVAVAAAWTMLFLMLQLNTWAMLTRPIDLLHLIL